MFATFTRGHRITTLWAQRDAVFTAREADRSRPRRRIRARPGPGALQSKTAGDDMEMDVSGRRWGGGSRAQDAPPRGRCRQEHTPCCTAVGIYVEQRTVRFVDECTPELGCLAAGPSRVRDIGRSRTTVLTGET